MELAKERLQGAVLLRHEDVRTAGIPDLSVTLRGKTSWWEFKHATPNYPSTGIQELTCLRLAAAGTCFYVIYHEEGNYKRTLIIHPRNIKTLDPEVWQPGFDHSFVIDYIKWTHR